MGPITSTSNNYDYYFYNNHNRTNYLYFTFTFNIIWEICWMQLTVHFIYFKIIYWRFDVKEQWILYIFALQHFHCKKHGIWYYDAHWETLKITVHLSQKIDNKQVLKFVDLRRLFNRYIATFNSRSYVTCMLSTYIKTIG